MLSTGESRPQVCERHGELTSTDNTKILVAVFIDRYPYYSVQAGIVRFIPAPKRYYPELSSLSLKAATNIWEIMKAQRIGTTTATTLMAGARSTVATALVRYPSNCLSAIDTAKTINDKA